MDKRRTEPHLMINKMPEAEFVRMFVSPYRPKDSKLADHRGRTTTKRNLSTFVSRNKSLASNTVMLAPISPSLNKLATSPFAKKKQSR